MTISRRDVLLGATAAAALAPIAARAEAADVPIGIIYPFSGANAQQGVDAQKAYEVAADVINKDYDFDLPLTFSAAWLASPEMVAVERVAELAGRIAQSSGEVDDAPSPRH